ncbi:MAG: 2-hydroxycarboxylate transporter family protein [Caulobacteraceae bacterium]
MGIPTDQGAGRAGRGPLEAWWRVMGLRLGVVPLPVFGLILVLIWALVRAGRAPADIPTAMAVLAVGGFACAELGKRLPLINRVGAAAIFATFIPSWLVFAHLLPAPLVNAITTFTKESNILYLFIASIIVGSILGMDRRVLVGGFLKIFIPLAGGSIAAGIVGCAVGAGLGLGLKHTFFMIVAPIMAGGVGEGALPLSIGYAAIGHQPQGAVFAEVLPPVMLGSLTAILLSGALNYLGKRVPALTGEGRLQLGDADIEVSATPLAVDRTAAVEVVAAAALMAVTLYLAGAVIQEFSGFPAPVAMLILTVALKLGRLVPGDLERGAHQVYQFFRAAVTYPLLFAIGVAMTPWDKLVAAFNAPTLATIAATVATLMGGGFVIARRVGLYPIDAAIVNACHSGQGGTGDVAILSAANRMPLMPFAQIATRIGGAITVAGALFVLRLLGG